MPAASVITTTVGALRSGKMSTSVRRVTMTPYISNIPAMTRTDIRLASEAFMILLSIAAGY